MPSSQAQVLQPCPCPCPCNATHALAMLPHPGHADHAQAMLTTSRPSCPGASNSVHAHGMLLPTPRPHWPRLGQAAQAHAILPKPLNTIVNFEKQKLFLYLLILIKYGCIYRHFYQKCILDWTHNLSLVLVYLDLFFIFSIAGCLCTETLSQPPLLWGSQPCQ